MARLQAVLHARAWVAGESAGAWGELRAAISPALRTEIAERFEQPAQDDETPVPAPSDAREAHEIPLDDGDGWPEFAKYTMLRWPPEDLQRAHARLESSMTANGDWLELNPSDEAAVVAALARLGRHAVRDDELIARANGHG